MPVYSMYSMTSISWMHTHYVYNMHIIRAVGVILSQNRRVPDDLFHESATTPPCRFTNFWWESNWSPNCDWYLSLLTQRVRSVVQKSVTSVCNKFQYVTLAQGRVVWLARTFRRTLNDVMHWDPRYRFKTAEKKVTVFFQSGSNGNLLFNVLRYTFF